MALQGGEGLTGTEEALVEGETTNGGAVERAGLSHDAVAMAGRTAFPGETAELLDDGERADFIDRHYGTMDPMGG